MFQILEKSGIGIPKYYEWRSRSGCYFCFFQRKEEWVGLHDRHPELFKKAMEYEEFHREKGRSYTWSQGEYLEDLISRRDEIMRKAKRQEEIRNERKPKKLLQAIDSDNDDEGCLICTL